MLGQRVFFRPQAADSWTQQTNPNEFDTQTVLLQQEAE
jgi:hypothetical protein